MAALAILSPAPVRASGVTPLPPVVAADGRLGLCDVLPGGPSGTSGPSWAQLAYAAGARINRWEFRWDRVEPSRGHWNFSSDDAAVNSSRSAGLDMLGILIGTPGWAVAAGQKPGNGLPNGLYLPYSDPRNLWADYVRSTVTHYAGVVRYWEIWNEPDLGFFWSGSSENYFRLLKVAYLTITHADPEAEVLVAGMVSPDMGFLQRVLDDAKNDPLGAVNHGFFDAVSWHQYGPAGRLLANIVRIKSMLLAGGFGAPPIWITEDGFPSSNPNGEARQAAFVEQTIAYAFAAGASHVLFYRESDDTQRTRWGLLSATGAFRQGYVAFQVAAAAFAHVRSVVYAPSGSLERFSLYGPGTHTIMLWTRTATPQSTVLAASPNVTLEDWQGLQSVPDVADGRMRLTAPPATYNVGVDPSGSVVGGPPLFVRQNDSSPQSLPEQRYVPPLSGPQKKLILVNDAAVPALLRVGATGLSTAKSLAEIPPHATQLVDLDLLAGPEYNGSFRLSSQLPLSTAAISREAMGAAAASSTSWDVPAAPGGLVLVNPSGRSVALTVSAYGPKGLLRASWPVRLPPAGSLLSKPPASLATTRLAFHIAAEKPVLVTAPTASVPGIPAGPQTSWYAVRPQGRGIAIFNPDASTPATVELRELGRTAVPVRQFVIPPHGSVRLRSAQDSAVEVTSNHPVAAVYAGGAGDADLAASATTHSVQAVGHSVVLDLLNPQDAIAHVTITRLRSGTARTSTITVGHHAVAELPIPDSNGSARGVVVDSDVPIVSQVDG